MANEDTSGCREIWLTPEAEERLEIFARAQTGDLEPLARYIKRGGWLTPDMREFMAAYHAGQIKFKRGASDDPKVAGEKSQPAPLPRNRAESGCLVRRGTRHA